MLDNEILFFPKLRLSVWAAADVRTFKEDGGIDILVFNSPCKIKIHTY